MDESVVTRIEKLERSNRRWKASTLILASILLGTSISGTCFIVQDNRALRAMQEARDRMEFERRLEVAAREFIEADLLEKK